MRVNATDTGIELYFPPFRALKRAAGLALFGIVAAAVGLAGTETLGSAFGAHTGGVMTAVLLISFVLPFTFFGAVFVAIAAFMALNALLVRADADAITTWRILFGVVVKQRCIRRADISAIDAQIAARDQSPFSRAPVYRLVAVDRARSQRVVVAEDLEGEDLMQRIKTLLENGAPPERDPLVDKGTMDDRARS